MAKLPSSLTWDSGDAALQPAMSRACEKALQAAIGDNLLLRYRSQYTGLFFRPTTAQADAGARWFSCLAAAPQDRGLGALPRRLPELSKRMPDAVARCVTGTRTLKYTTCADRHGWRSTYSFYVDGRPTDRNVNRASQRVCSRHTSGRTWLHSVLPVSSKRFIMGCYTKTSR